MISKTRLLFDNTLECLLKKEGYVIVSFLDIGEVDQLLEFLKQNKPEILGAFHATHFSTNRTYKRKVNDFIIATTRIAFRKYFTEHYAPIFANFMIKEANGNNPMPLHADWTYVDENVSSSFAIWTPLVDTNETNGCFCVIPFSQQLSQNIRGPRIQQWNYPVNEKLISAMGKPIYLKAGEAIIYNHRLLHYSSPNNSSFQRPALNISVVPANEPIIHYSMPERVNKILKFDVKSTDFYIEYDNFQMPSSGIEIESFNFTEDHIIDKKAEKFIKKNKSLNYFNKIINLLGIGWKNQCFY